jgi:LAO/AO transport system kinase
MVPGLGDDIQSIKAGIMEIGDLFVVNKSDIFGAERTATEINMMLDMSPNTVRRPPVVMVTANQNKNIEQMEQEIQKHYQYLVDNGLLEQRRKKNIKRELLELIEEELKKLVIRETENNGELDSMTESLFNKETDPFTLRDILLSRIK